MFGFEEFVRAPIGYFTDENNTLFQITTGLRTVFSKERIIRSLTLSRDLNTNKVAVIVHTIQAIFDDQYMQKNEDGYFLKNITLDYNPITLKELLNKINEKEIVRYRLPDQRIQELLSEIADEKLIERKQLSTDKEKSGKLSSSVLSLKPTQAA